jgi:hypothetical protein
MRKLGPSFATASLVVCLTGSLFAQGERTAAQRQAIDTTADALVLDYDYATGAQEYARVFLESGQVYRAELSSPDVTFVIRSVGNRIRAPRVYPILGPESSSGASVVELYPDTDGLYEIRTSSANGSGVATRLRLYRDIRESHRRTALLNKPGWEIGLELATAWHSGFAQSNGPLSATAPDPHAGTDVEACFTARRELGRGGACVVGIGYQSQVGARSILWVYTEPRLGLVGKAVRGRSNWEGGALFRLGLGSIERTSTTPVILAPGAYVARQIQSSGSGVSWSVQASYSHAWYAGFPSSPENAGGPPHSDRITLGLGWYH